MGTSREQATAGVDRLLRVVRALLTHRFSADTAVDPSAWSEELPSTGHCAAVAAIVWARHGGELVSATVNGQSHWFNRFGGLAGIDGDITGDQFGGPRTQVADADRLHGPARVRRHEEINKATLRRAIRLAKRAGMWTEAALLSLLLEAGQE